MKAIYITATGTDVGKTYVSALLVKRLRQAGIYAGYYKPALSGAEIIDGQTVPGDAQFVCKTANLDLSPSECVSYAFPPAVSPHLAARWANQPIDLDKIETDFQRLKNRYEKLVVEGAGGIVCPFRYDPKQPDQKILQEDVIARLKLPVLIVADAGLGSINSAIVTIEYIRSRDIPVVGVVLNRFRTGDPLHEDNRAMIAALGKVKILAVAAPEAADLEIDPKDVFQEPAESAGTPG